MYTFKYKLFDVVIKITFLKEERRGAYSAIRKLKVTFSKRKRIRRILPSRNSFKYILERKDYINTRNRIFKEKRNSIRKFEQSCLNGILPSDARTPSISNRESPLLTAIHDDDVTGSQGNRRENRHFHGNWSARHGIEKSGDSKKTRGILYLVGPAVVLNSWQDRRSSLRLSQISRCPGALLSPPLSKPLEFLLSVLYKWKIEDSLFTLSSR